jgi:hypothetical protein
VQHPEYSPITYSFFLQRFSTIFQVAGICVDYHDRAAVSISVAVTHTFGFPRLRFHKASQASVDNGNVRVIATTSEPLQYHLLSVSFSGEERVVQKILPEVGVPS